VYELQQYSDTTYRVYDWGRVGIDGKLRTLHIDKALTVMDLQPRPAITAVPEDQTDQGGNQMAVLVRGTYFGLDRLRVTAAGANYTPGGTCHLLSVIAGAIWVDDVRIPKGRSALIPAGLAHYRLRPDSSGETPEVLRAWPMIRSG
jgi:mannose-6-phosphate isomerase